MKLPKTIEENWEFRAQILSKARKDLKFQSAIRAIIKEDIFFWINAFCWIYDAKGDIHKKLGYDTSHMLFRPFPYQVNYIKNVIRHIEAGKDLLTEKSRDMGGSWMIITIFQWYWQFGGSGNDFLIGSRKGELVDKLGILDALFPKIRYQLYRQPKWLMPLGFNEEIHDNFMRIINPETGSFLKGETINSYFGTSGRNKATMLDEFGKCDNTDESAWQSLSDVTNCRLPISSANGETNKFYRLVTQEDSKIDVARLFWKSHPLKGADWYENEKTRRSPEDLAAEVDINYTASVRNRAYLSFDYNVHCKKPYPVRNTNLPIVLECDFNINPMCWAISQDVNGMDDYVDEIAIKGDTRTEFAAIEFRDRFKNHKNKELIIYGDASGKYGSTNSRENNYEIIKRILRKTVRNPKGWQIVFQLRKKNPPVNDRIQATNKRFCDWENNNRSYIRINPEKCPTLVKSAQLTKKSGDGLDKKGNVEHMMDGVGYKQEFRHPIKKKRLYGIRGR